MLFLCLRKQVDWQWSNMYNEQCKCNLQQFQRFSWVPIHVRKSVNRIVLLLDILYLGVLLLTRCVLGVSATVLGFHCQDFVLTVSEHGKTPQDSGSRPQSSRTHHPSNAYLYPTCVCVPSPCIYSLKVDAVKTSNLPCSNQKGEAP